MDRNELQFLISRIEQSLYSPQPWYRSIIRFLVCRFPSDKHDISDDAHKECRFGQWYYEKSTETLRMHSGFIALEVRSFYCVFEMLARHRPRVAERLRTGNQKLKISLSSDKSMRTPVSFGISALMPETLVEKAIENTERALYKAKEAGRNHTKVDES